MPHNHSHNSECGPQGQRTDVAHENFGRIGVEPQERQPRAGHRRAEHCEFPGARNMRQAEIL